MARDGMDDDTSDRFVGDTHPDAEAIQRWVDGTVDPVAERSLIDHVQDCEACGDQVDCLRRVEAALALSSRPPGDLLTRIKARRAAGERVLLAMPNVGVAAAEERGERVAPRTASFFRGRVRGRNYAWPTAIAAALVCAISLRLAVQSTVDDAAPGPSAARPAYVAADSTAAPAPAAATAKTRGTLGPETMDRSVPVAAPKPAPVSEVTPRDQLLAQARSAVEGVRTRFAVLTPVRASGDTISIGLVESAFDAAALTTAAVAALRELGAALGQGAGYRLTVSAASGSPEQRVSRTRAVVDALVAGGIERGRIRQVSRPSRSARAGGVIDIDVTLPR